MQAQLAAPREEHVAAEPSRIADRFQVEAVLGQGGMGAVYRVHDLSLGRKLALKRLRSTDKAKHVALFEREYHTLAGLRHPNIVEVYDYGRDALGPYYTMELLEGSDILDKAPMPWPEVCRVLRDVCAGLALIHARGLLHRDVSARNVWCRPDGQVKLIDFGALTAFGTVLDLAGTPPYIPPEAVRGQMLDQRYDLYAVGALGYWLLTGLNAFPARSLAELSEVWGQLPRAASERVRELERSNLPAVPSELDELIAALLSADQAARPDTATEVIDRLSSIAGFEPAGEAFVIESHLRSKRFVGRERERELLASTLRRTQLGKGRSICVEAQQGLGRTRFLAEAALEGRLAGAVVLEANAAMQDGPYGLALALVFKLLQTQPEAARAAAQPLAPVLGHLGAGLCEAFGISAGELTSMPETPGEARMRLQVALQDWFCALAEARPLALFVDDAQAADEASLAWLTALAHQSKDQRLMVVAAVRLASAEPQPSALVALRAVGRVITLNPLTHAQTHQLLASVLGHVPHLGRLVDCLHRLAEGNPEHCMQLAEHMMRAGSIRHVGGTWVLPQEIDEASLPTSRTQRIAARLDRLSQPARALARVLSIQRGVATLDLCERLSELDSRARFAALEELVREGVLTGSSDGYRFQDELVRGQLHSELEPARAQRAHLMLGELMLANPGSTSVERVEAGYHLLQSRDESAELHPRGVEVIARAGVQMAMLEPTAIPPAVPALEASLVRFRAKRRSAHELVTLLAPLVVAGYYADRKLVSRHSEEAVATLERIVGLHVTRRVRPLLGRKLGLYVGLLWGAIAAFFQRRRSPAVPPFRELVAILFNVVTTSTGVSTICIDADGGERFVRVIEPLTALGPHHVASVVHEFASCLTGTVRDRLGDAYVRWQRLLELVSATAPVAGLTDHIRMVYRAGGLYALGVMECWREDSRALQIADQLDGFGMKLYEMSADQLRMLYHAYRGDLELAERYRAKLELHAIQRGSAWQVETWTPGAMITVHLRTYDAMRVKQCLEQVRELSKEIPALSVYTRRAQGAYLLTRNKPQAAVAVLEHVLKEPPQGIVGWGRMHGVLARAHNALGEHARAREITERALARMTPQDLEFTGVNLILQLEHAIALAGTGEAARGRESLEQLLGKYEQGQCALTLGALHESLAKIATMAGRERAAAMHHEAMERWYRSTKIASLIERCERVAWLRRAAERKHWGPSSGPSTSDSPHLLTIMHRIRHGGESQASSGAQWALEQLGRYAELRVAFLYLSRSDGAERVASLGEQEPAPGLEAWVAQRMGPVRTASSITAQVEGLASSVDPNRFIHGGQSYRLATLRVGVGAAERVVGALVLLEVAGQSSCLPFDLLRALAGRLLETHALD